MAPVVRVRCNVCGQIWEMQAVGMTHDAPPSFCPSCGAQALMPNRSSFDQLSAPCFKQWDRQLVQLAYEAWNMPNNASYRAAYPMLVSYIRALTSGLVPLPSFGDRDKEDPE